LKFILVKYITKYDIKDKDFESDDSEDSYSDDSSDEN